MDGLIIVRGGGDLATGTIYKLVQCGYSVLALETEHPSAIRRPVAFSECVYDGQSVVEGMCCRLARDADDARTLLRERRGPILLVDPKGTSIAALRPRAVVDAILAKRNLGTTRQMAPTVIGLGPGFTAGADVHFVIETMRGHRLGRVLTEGSALPNTGIPGVIAGYGAQRVIHAPVGGTIHNIRAIGDLVTEGEPIASITHAGGVEPVPATLSGVLRGLIREGYPVTAGFKLADIDPRRSEQNNCFTISDKARCIAGGVLEALLRAGCLPQAGA